MEAASRRQAILDRLRTADRPVSASALAAGLNVSRQIIVGDIALLRAGGAEISAPPRGYVLPRATDGITRSTASSPVSSRSAVATMWSSSSRASATATRHR